MQELFIINKIIYQVGAATIYTYIIYLLSSTYKCNFLGADNKQ